MTTKTNASKQQMFSDKLQSQKPITLRLLPVALSGLLFMHNGTVVKGAPTLSIPSATNTGQLQKEIKRWKLVYSTGVIDISVWEAIQINSRRGFSTWHHGVRTYFVALCTEEDDNFISFALS